MSRTSIIGLTVFALLVVAAIAAMFLQSDASGGGGVGRTSSGRRIAVIPLQGTIQGTNGGVLSGGAVTPTMVRGLLRRAERDKAVRAVVLRVETPGGSAAASQEIAETIRTFREESDKPVVISMGDQATSGGYYISTGADRIVAQPDTLTGSIGVIWLNVDVSGLLDKIGVKLDPITAGKHKGMFLPGRMTPEERQLVQTLIGGAYDRFVQTVADARGLPVERVRELATGEIYSGQQAKDLGLVDTLGGLDTALDVAAELAKLEDYSEVSFSPTLLEQLFGPSYGTGLLPRLLGAEADLAQRALSGGSQLWYWAG